MTMELLTEAQLPGNCVWPELFQSHVAGPISVSLDVSAFLVCLVMMSPAELKHRVTVFFLQRQVRHSYIHTTVH